ncbi:MAG: heme biosynthesis HemY N-terminal domain-containing protein [Acetobacterales bacterium]
MFRALRYFLLLAAVVAGAVWLAQRPGQVAIDWLGYRIEAPMALLVAAVLVLMLASGALARLWGALRRAPGDFRDWRQARRRRRGYEALTQGLVAIAAGDAESAARLAGRADALLGDPPLTMLLSAQAAQLNGDDKAAETYFTAMLDEPEMTFLGLRGLLTQAMRQGDTDRALALAKRAHEMRADATWPLMAMFDLQVGQGDWAGAVRTIGDASRRKLVDRDAAKRREAVLLYRQSLETPDDVDGDAAFRMTRRAHELAPDLAPATMRYAQLLLERRRRRRVPAILRQAWQRMPHPDFVPLWQACFPDDAPLQRVKRLRELTSVNPDHAESHIALAEACLDAELWGSARQHLEAAERTMPTGRVYRLLAGVEERERGDGEAVRGWLERAAAADPDPVWTCTSCGAATRHWAPVCAECGSFDSLAWRSPRRGVPVAIGAARPAALPVTGGRVEAGAGGDVPGDAGDSPQPGQARAAG